MSLPLSPAQVMDYACDVPNMVPFFSLLGECILRGKSRTALRMLIAIPLDHKRAWKVIAEWEDNMTHEMVSGWTPEARAMLLVMADVHEFQDVNWKSLLLLLKAGTLDPMEIDSQTGH